MQRFFTLDDQLNVEVTPITNVPPKKNTEGPSVATRNWTFNVIMSKDLLPNEVLAVTGDCDLLGNWIPGHSILLNHVENSSSWSKFVKIPRDKVTEYRYFVCAIEPITENVIVRRWETHITPRVIPLRSDKPETHDIFGDIEGEEKIDRGWLTSESIVQLKFYNSPFVWKQRLKKRLLFVKVTPMHMRINSDQHHLTPMSPLEDSLSNDTRDNGMDSNPFSFTEVATLKMDENLIETQNQFGTSCGVNDIVIFHITITDPENTAYLIDLYAYSSKAVQDDPPFHLGYHYILPNVFKQSEGRLEVPINCATKHRPMGMMQVGYLFIKPIKSLQFDMKRSYQRYWNPKWAGLDVGHRGSGTSFKTNDDVIRENTIASLKNAAEHGADMVEFDVQLSKDLVPVIYHDFHVYVSLKSKGEMKTNELLGLPMRELTLEQLKNLKVYHTCEGKSRKPRSFCNDDLQEHQPFPQLADVLESIDEHVGFNIEVKWSQQLYDGTMEEEFEHVVDRNLYVECILEVVFRKAGNRRIVFSCFDPDICTMLRYKQNRYPVMFLTLGSTTKYKKYKDPRCNTIESAVCNARAMELLGIVAHTEDLLRDPTQVNLAKNLGLIVFCWGDDNNSKDTIRMLKTMGLHAIIYDKMDVLTTKEIKESVFLVQAKENQRELLKIQCQERGGKQKRRTSDNQPILMNANSKMLCLENERQKLAMSTATSLASLLDHND